MDAVLTIFGIAWRFAVGAATVIALAFIVWNIAAAIEERRIERRRKAQWEARKAAAQRLSDRAVLHAGGRRGIGGLSPIAGEQVVGTKRCSSWPTVGQQFP